MKMIQIIADKAVGLLVPQATATADQGYWEYVCVPGVCQPPNFVQCGC